jgi:hypothetical protein
VRGLQHEFLGSMEIVRTSLGLRWGRRGSPEDGGSKGG